MTRFDEAELNSLALLPDGLPESDWRDVERRSQRALRSHPSSPRRGRLRSMFAVAATLVGVAALLAVFGLIVAGHHGANETPAEQKTTPLGVRSATNPALTDAATGRPVAARYGFQVRQQPGWHVRIFQDEPSPPGGRGVEASTVPLGPHGTPPYARLRRGDAYVQVFDYGQQVQRSGPKTRHPPALQSTDFGGRFEGVPTADGFAQTTFTTGEEAFTAQIVTGGGPPTAALLRRINTLLAGITVPNLLRSADPTADPAAIGGYGLAARIPVGWHAQVFRKTDPSRTMIVLVAATVPIDNRLDDINGGDTVADLRGGDVLISIYSYGPRTADPASTPRTSPPSLSVGQFGRGMEGSEKSHTGAVVRFASRRYAYTLLVETVRPGPTAAQLRRINSLLAEITVP